MKYTYSYSLIIPHHNIPHLLQRCLDTIPIREDLQIIIVDDNSDSNIVDFDCFPGLGRKNTEVYFTKEGKGAGYARNVGLKHALGKWLIFVDADDILLDDFDSILNKYINSISDILYFKVNSAYCDTLQPADRHLNKEVAFNKYAKNPEQLVKYLKYGYTEPWGKLIKHDLVREHNILFDESQVANDYWFSVQTGYYAKQVKLVDDRFYCITVRRGSLSNAVYDSEQKCISRLLVCTKVQSFYDEKNIKLYPLYQFLNGVYRYNRPLLNKLILKCNQLGYSNGKLICRFFISYLRLFLRSSNRYC